MKLQFFKYQGTGNDFVIIDNRNPQHEFTKEQVVYLCDRKFGIGSDGLILLQNHPNLDFEMVFYNPDASQSFCGNGSRCAVVFAKKLGLFETKTTFLSTDGEHQAELLPNAWVKLKMHDVNDHEWIGSHLFLNTGSPHYILPLQEDAAFDLIEAARTIRYDDRFAQEGVNVNFTKVQNNILEIRTYERGVENETLSCGTGVTAAALAQHLFLNQKDGSYQQKVQSQGGELSVSFDATNSEFSNIYLEGPAMFVYEGIIRI